MVDKGKGTRPLVHGRFDTAFWSLIWPYKSNLEMRMLSDPGSQLPEIFLKDPEHECTQMYGYWKPSK